MPCLNLTISTESMIAYLSTDDPDTLDRMRAALGASINRLARHTLGDNWTSEVDFVATDADAAPRRMSVTGQASFIDEEDAATLIGHIEEHAWEAASEALGAPNPLGAAISAVLAINARRAPAKSNAELARLMGVDAGNLHRSMTRGMPRREMRKRAAAALGLGGPDHLPA